MYLTMIVYTLFNGHRVLRGSHIECMWQSTRGCHEAVARVLHHLLLLIVPVLDPPLRGKLFNLISSTPFQEVSEQTLLLLKTFTIKVLKAMEENGESFQQQLPNNLNGKNMGVNRNVLGYDDRYAITRKSVSPGIIQRPWIGLSVLWQYIQDPDLSALSDVNAEVGISIDDNKVDLAVSLLVELLNEEFKDDREEIIYRCLENVQNGISVPVSLQVIRRTLACFPLPAKGWFGTRQSLKTPTVTSLIERLQKQNKMLDIFFSDLERYQKLFLDQLGMNPTDLNGSSTGPSLTSMLNSTGAMNHQNSSSSLNATSGSNWLGSLGNTTMKKSRSGGDVKSLNDKRVRIQGRIMRTPHLKGIRERLEFLKFILLRSPLMLDESQTTLLWSSLGEGAKTIETLDTFVDWLDCLISNEGKYFGTFLTVLGQESDVTDSLSLSKLAFLAPKANNNFTTGNNSQSLVNDAEQGNNSSFEDGVLLKLFEEKICPWALKRENCGSLSRLPVAILCLKLFLLVNISNKAIKVEQDGSWCLVGNLVGVSVIWCMTAEVDNSEVADAATTLLVELHHRLGSKHKESESIRGSFLKRCFTQLSQSIQSLREIDPTRDTAVAPRSAEFAERDISSHNNMNNSNYIEFFSYDDSQLRAEKRRLESQSQPNNIALTSLSVVPLVSSSIAPPQPINVTKPRGGTTTNTATDVDEEYFHEDRNKYLPPPVILRKVARYVMLMRLFIQRFGQKPTQLIALQILVGREESLATEITLRASDTVGVLRDKISQHFHEPADTILLLKQNKSRIGVVLMLSSYSYTYVFNFVSMITGNTNERLSRMDVTLLQAKLRNKDAIIARKMDPPVLGKPVTNVVDKTLTAPVLPDLISPQDLNPELLAGVEPFVWLSDKGSTLNSVPSQQSSEVTSASTYQGLERCFTFPSIPLPHHQDMTVVQMNPSAKKASTATTVPTTNAPNNNNNPYGSTTANIASDNSYQSLAEYLGPYLKQRPEHFDQLFEMLDGYLSMEIQGIAGLGADVSSAVWEVIQSLPTHPEILKQVRSIPSETDTKNRYSFSFRKLLDTGSPYRLLYTLQIIDSIVAGTGQINATTSTAATTTATASINNPALEWCWRFLHLGGVEHLLDILRSLMGGNGSLQGTARSSQVSHHSSSFSALIDEADSDSRLLTVSSSEAYVLTITLLIRLLYRLLCLDPAYHVWQPIYLLSHSFQESIGANRGNNSQLAQAIINSSGNSMNSNFPRGVILSTVDAQKLIQDVMACVFRVAGSMNAGGIHPVALKTLAEHAIFLVLGLATSSERGVEMLKAYDNIGRWIRAICLRNPVQSIRRSTCQRILEYAALIVIRNVDPTISNEEKLPRRKLFHFLLYTFLVSAHPAYSKNRYSNICGPNSSRKIDSGQELSSMKDNLGNLSSTEFEKLDSLLAPETYAFAEQLYSLIGGLLALRNNPDIKCFNGFDIASIYGNNDLLVGNINHNFLNMNTSNGVEEYWVDETDLCHAFVEKLTGHKSTESFHSTKPDGALVGILRILLVLSNGSSVQRKLLGYITPYAEQSGGSSSPTSRNLLSFLYLKCLFPPFASVSSTTMMLSDTKEGEVLGALCHTNESRALTYALLYQLCDTEDESNLSKLVTVMYDEQSNSDGCDSYGLLRMNSSSLSKNSSRSVSTQRQGYTVTSQWAYDPCQLIKEEGAHVGLVNQGATCYMNSFLQQLFHVPSFASGLLEIQNNYDTNKEYLNENNNNTSMIDDNELLLFQLQVLFGYLHLSQKKCYDTLPFCRAFKDYDGQCLSLSEQKDINEFASMLFEKLESNKQCGSLLQKLFGGKLVWQIISTETEYRSEREEPFYMITAEVKDKATLEDSLDLFIAGEMLTGDNKIEDDKAGKKVDALRRCAIRVLPEILIIHLKRFEFDLETLNRKKLNDQLTFPMELNMFPYTEEGIALKEARLRSTQSMDQFESDGNGKLESGKFSERLDLDDNNESTILRRTSSWNENDMNAQKDDDIVSTDNSSDNNKEDDEEDENNNDVKNEDNDEGKEDSKKSDGKKKSKSYHAQTQDSKYYEYALKGVVAHVGAIDSGHYYSFIKERQNNRWLEFNDRTVLPFSAEAIPRECFGGVDNAANSNGNRPSDPSLKQNNAYLLFYERRVLDNNNNAQSLTMRRSNNSQIFSDNNNKHNNDYGSSSFPTTYIGAWGDETSSVSTLSPNKSRRESTNSNHINEDMADNIDVVYEMNDDPIGGSSAEAEEPDKKIVFSKRVSDEANHISESIKDTNKTLKLQKITEMKSRHLSISFDNVLRDEFDDAIIKGKNISKRVLQAVWSENMVFLRDRHLFHPIHFRFMWLIQHAPAVSRLIECFPKKQLDKSDNSKEGNETIAAFISDDGTYDQSELQRARARTLTQLAILLLKFDVEVLCHARALSCVSMFLEKLEDLVINDNSGAVCLAILIELSQDPLPLPQNYSAAPSSPYTTSTSSKSAVNGTGISNEHTIINDQSFSREKAFLEENCHPWLLHMFVLCPYSSIIEAFARLILVCFKRMRMFYGESYIHLKMKHSERKDRRSRARSNSSNSSAAATMSPGSKGHNAPYANTATEAGTTGDVSPMRGKEKIELSQEKNKSKASGTVTKCVTKLLILLENLRSEDMIGKDGYRVLSKLLYDISSLGYQERGLFIQIGGVSKLCLSILAVHPGNSKTTLDTYFSTIKLISTLIRSAMILPSSDGSSRHLTPRISSYFLEFDKVPEGIEIMSLQADDLSTFLNRIYLDDAILIDAADTSLALQHICWSRYGRESGKILEFLGDRIIEFINIHPGQSTNSNANANSANNPLVFMNYKPFFRVVSELLLGGAVDLQVAFDTIMNSFMKRAELSVTRQTKSDAEFVFSFMKLLYRIGISSQAGQNLVIRSRDMWQSIRSSGRGKSSNYR